MLYWIECLAEAPPKDRKLFIKHKDKIHGGKYLLRRGNKFYFHLDSGSETQPRPGTHWCLVPDTLLETIQSSNSPTPMPVGRESVSNPSKTATKKTAQIVPPLRDDEIFGYGDDGLPRNHRGEILPLFGGDDW